MPRRRWCASFGTRVCNRQCNRSRTLGAFRGRVNLGLVGVDLFDDGAPVDRYLVPLSPAKLAVSYPFFPILALHRF